MEDVEESEGHEPPRRLIPARVEPDKPRIALIFERSDRAARRQKAEHGGDVHAETRELRMDRKGRSIGRDGVLEEHVEHALVPDRVVPFGSRGPATWASAAA